MTYREAYNKIIDAYFKDEIKPMDPNFCFCGTLAGGSSWVYSKYLQEEHDYSREEYVEMEKALLLRVGAYIPVKPYLFDQRPAYVIMGDRLIGPVYEENLFKGMCAALDVLKGIHMGRGEEVEELPFTKRQLQIT